jgi:ABC-type polysaccharide/polyol phosphate export permease
MLRFISISAIVSIALTYLASSNSSQWGAETIGGFMVLLQIALIAFLIPSLASSLVSTETESGGWTLLLMTPLRAYSIVVGKLLSVIWTTVLVLIGTLPGYMVLIWIKPELRVQVYSVMLSLCLASLLALSVSALISTMFRKSAVSTAVAYAVVVTLFSGTLLIWLGRDNPFGYQIVRNALLVNPIALALESMQFPGFTDYNLLPLGWLISAIFSTVCIVGFAYNCWRLTRPR